MGLALSADPVFAPAVEAGSRPQAPVPRWRDTSIATCGPTALLLLAVRACPPLCTPRHWPWRARAASLLTRLYALAGRSDAALAVLDTTMHALDVSMSEAEAVPPVAAGVRWAIGHALATVHVARFAVEAGGYGAARAAALARVVDSAGGGGGNAEDSEGEGKGKGKAKPKGKGKAGGKGNGALPEGEVNGSDSPLSIPIPSSPVPPPPDGAFMAIEALRASRAALQYAPRRLGQPQVLLMGLLAALPPPAAPIGSAIGGGGAGSEIVPSSGGASGSPVEEAGAEDARALTSRLLLRAACAVVMPRLAHVAARVAAAAVFAVGGMSGASAGATVGRRGREERSERRGRMERQRRAAAEAACPDVGRAASKSRCPPSGTTEEEAEDEAWWRAHRRRALDAVEVQAGIRREATDGDSDGESKEAGGAGGSGNSDLIEQLFWKLPLDPPGLDKECPAVSDRVILRAPGIATEVARKRAALAPLLWRRAAEAEHQSLRSRRASAASRWARQADEAQQEAAGLREAAARARRRAEEEEAAA